MIFNLETHDPVEQTTLHYRAAYLALFSDVAALAEQIETAGVRISLGEVHDRLARALARAEEAACE
nr:hypothetical protein [uncultured Agathobaculum sp.]